MRYQEITEEWYRTLRLTKDYDLDVFINPAKGELTTLLMKSAGKCLRALLARDGSIIVWDAYCATHTDVEDALRRGDMIGGYLYLHPDHIDFNDMNYHANNQDEYPEQYAYRPIVWRYYLATLAHPTIQRFYGPNPKIIGFDDEDAAGLGLPHTGFEITREFMEKHVAPLDLRETILAEKRVTLGYEGRHEVAI